MRTSFIQRAATLLMVALIGSSMGGTSVSAQTPTPEPPQPTTIQVGTRENEGSPTITPQVTEGAFAEVEPTATADAIPLDTESTVTADAAPVIAEPETLLTNGDTQAEAPFVTNATTPSVIDISTPNGVVAGNVLTYTYTFTNTISDGDFYVQAWWLDYSPNSNGNKQYCDDKLNPKNCDAILPDNTTITVTRQPTCPPGITPASSTCYLVSGLARSQKGQFLVRMRTKLDLYPKTNTSITSLSGSAKLLPLNSTIGQGEDTAATLIVGPVLNITKTAVTTGSIYTGDQGTFRISTGNATGTNDKSADGTIRADARSATNIIVTDVIPTGATFVSDTQPNNRLPFDPSKDKQIKWSFPGPLAPGQKLPDIDITFQKIAGSSDCNNLNNSDLKGTSSEYPIVNGSTTIVGFTGKSIPVIVPLKIKSITASPSTLLFGESGEIQITVQNRKNVAFNNATLSYQLQNGISFVSAVPKESSKDQPTPTSAPKINWVFSIPAGSTSTPKEMTFVVKITAGFGKPSGTGTATITAADQQIDCNTLNGGVGFAERLTVRKSSAENYPKVNAIYRIPAAGKFEYYLEIQNKSSSTVTGLEIIDKIPTGNGSNFSYVAGSAEDQDGNPVTPTEVTSELIRWENLQVEGGATLRIFYTLEVKGLNYVKYCNTISAQIYHDGSDPETVSMPEKQVCLIITPPIEFAKTVDKPIIAMDDDGDTPVENRTVTYTLTATNKGTSSYPVGFIDILPTKPFEYIANSTVANPPTLGGEPTLNSGKLYWEQNFANGVPPMIAPGQTFTLSFKAIIPEGCFGGANTVHTNKMQFQDDISPVVIEPTPQAEVTANCGKVEATIKASPNPISLANTQDFEVTLKNTSKTNAESNLPVEVRLPSGYTYVGINTGSAITTAPTISISNTFTTLKWTLPSLGKDGASDASKQIKFKGRAGLTILPDTLADGAWARTTRNGKCPGQCVPDPLGGATWSATAVKVDALITLTSKFTQTGCAEVNTTRTYELTVSNNNANFEYTSTAISVTLPLGLDYVARVGTTPEPTTTTVDGKQTLVWKNQTIAKKGSATTTKLYSINLKVNGKGSGALSVSSIASSPIGAFPPRTGVVDPTVFICLSKPGLWFNSAPVSALPGQTAIFEIQATNPMSASYALGFEYTIPDQLEYITSTADIDDASYVTPTINNNVLSWPSITLPAAASTSSYGQLSIHFKMKIKDDAVLGTKITNKLKVTKNIASQTSMPVVEIKNDTTYLFVMRSFYLPVILH